jgi:acyl transferase domain-containing protein
MAEQDVDGIAIVGMAGRWPGAGDIGRLWQALSQGEEGITSFSEQELIAAGVPEETARDPRYVRAAGVVDGIDLFDAELFGYTPGEAAVTDPQQRLFLECAWEALEDAGCDPDRFPGRIAVYGGASQSTYRLVNLAGRSRTVSGFQAAIATNSDFLATRVSYKLNLRGPSVTVQTACSTSLAAVHMACQSLLVMQADLALAGGVSIGPQKSGYWYQEEGILSPDGHCRPFDAKAEGTVPGNGVGVVVLRRLVDAVAAGDRVYAVIVGSAMNNDGSGKVGFTAPSVDGQAEVVAEALALAGVRASGVGYVEAHGTGTVLGDPIEVRALRRVFEGDGAVAGGCGLGSVKSNVGHLDAAAGVAGLVKAVLSVQHGVIPPSLHFESPNPVCELEGSPFFVPRELTSWPVGEGPRRAGVSSFGIGGTNVHVVVEQAPVPVVVDGRSGPSVLLLSGRTEAAVDAGAVRLAEHLRGHPGDELGDVAFTLQVGRRQLEWRRAVVCGDREQALAGLLGVDGGRVRSGHVARRGREVVFMFPGQGAQYAGMGRELYECEPEYRRWIDTCAELLRPALGLDVRTVLHPASGDQESQRLNQTWLAQPAQFTVCYALARLWMSWGVRPVAMIGHSVAEYVAACLAGVFDLQDALTLVARRGGLMQSLPGGAMLGVPLAAEQVAPLLPPELSVAAVNGPDQCVVSGPTAAVAAYQAALARTGTKSRRLHTSHAFHSGMQDGIVEPMAHAAHPIRPRTPELAYVSGVDGTWAGDEVMKPDYWGRQLRRPVQFDAGMETVLTGYPDAMLLEVGPGTSLTSLVRRREGVAPEQAVASMRHPGDARADRTVLLTALAELWVAGVDVDWEAVNGPGPHRRLSLPGYPFQRRRYWVDGTEETPPRSRSEPAPSVRDDRPAGRMQEWVAAAWQDVMGVERVGADDHFFALGGNSLMATQVLARLADNLRFEPPIRLLFDHPVVADLADALEVALLERIGTQGAGDEQRQDS